MYSNIRMSLFINQALILLTSVTKRSLEALLTFTEERARCVLTGSVVHTAVKLTFIHICGIQKHNCGTRFICEVQNLPKQTFEELARCFNCFRVSLYKYDYVHIGVNIRKVNLYTQMSQNAPQSTVDVQIKE